MWNPALDYAEASPCRVEGWHRSFCFWTPLGRGTPELPGLMLALERGGACEGIAYRLAPHQVESELAILWNREMLAGFYKPQWVPATLRDGRTVTAVTFEVDSGALPVLRRPADREQAHHMAFAEGRRGTSRDYLANTAAHARALGIHDPYIEDMVERVAHLRGEDVAAVGATAEPKARGRAGLSATASRKSHAVVCAVVQSL